MRNYLNTNQITLMRNPLFLLALILLPIAALQAQDCFTPSGVTATLAGGEAAAASLVADATPLELDIHFTFIGAAGSWAADMGMRITSPQGLCIEFGGYNLPPDSNCTNIGNYSVVWPGNWNTNASGVYTATVDLSNTGLTGNGVWVVEVFNGYTTASQPSTYDVDFDFTCVYDTTPPVITINSCPGDQAFINFCPDANNISPEQLGVPVASAIDSACGEAVQLNMQYNDDYTFGCGDAADDNQPEGSYTVVRTFTFTAMDCEGNMSSAQCSQTITNVDTLAPELSVICPPAVSLELDASCDLQISSLAPTALGVPQGLASDNCDSQVRINYDFNDGPAIPNGSDAGFQFNRTWSITAKDDCGNPTGTTCVQTVNVLAGACILGCTYSDATNYDAAATAEDGSCTFDCEAPPILGCTNDAACNYNPLAVSNYPGVPCIYPVPGYDCQGNGIAFGCMDPVACNFDSFATVSNENQECIYADSGYDCFGFCYDDNGNGVCDVDDIVGCTYPDALNFNPDATMDDDSCVFDLGGSGCPTDIDGNGQTTMQDLLLLLGSFSLFCAE